MVGSIRVTHPCAGRHLQQAEMLPLDLHVLGLPLAFILSQDQTLHRYIFNIIRRLKKIYDISHAIYSLILRCQFQISQ